MVALMVADAVGVVLFGILYAVAGTRFMSQTAFFGCLLVLFALVTALWLRTEARHRGHRVLVRCGRALVGLVVVIAATPMAVLMPLFWLDTQLPPETGLRALLAPIMTIVLIALVLVVLTNLIGAAIIAGRAAFRPRGERP